MTSKIKKQHFVFTLIALVGLLLAIISTFLLPSKFFNDATIIVLDKYNEIGLRGSYAFSIWFYKYTGLKKLPYYLIAIIQYLILIYILYKIGLPKRFHKVTIKNTIVYLSFFLIAIFICVPSKEFITFIYIAFIVFLFKNRKGKLFNVLIKAFALLFFFAFFFREYFALVVVLSISMHLISFVSFKSKRIVTIATGLLLLICISLSYGVVKGKFISESTRYDVNNRRIELNTGNANSLITSPIKPDTWYGESFSIVYGFFSVNLPFNGIKHLLSPQIVAFLIWQTFLIVILFIRYKRSLLEGKKENYDLWVFYIVFSYFIVQGVFEPDLGSSIRHKIGILPLIYYALYYEEFRKKLP